MTRIDRDIWVDISSLQTLDNKHCKTVIFERKERNEINPKTASAFLLKACPRPQCRKGKLQQSKARAAGIYRIKYWRRGSSQRQSL